jgi:hypothetical protein
MRPQKLKAFSVWLGSLSGELSGTRENDRSSHTDIDCEKRNQVLDIRGVSRVHTREEETLREGNYFFLYFLRATFSQPERLELCFLWQAFSAAASFWARSCAAVFAFGQPLTLIGVL